MHDSPPPHAPTPDRPATSAALTALAAKYRTLAALRRAKSAGEPPPGREVFRDLARKFPGALRELDTLPLADLDARAEALEQTAMRGGPPTEWMFWQLGYHAWMRVALDVKARFAGGRESASHPAGYERLASEVEARAGLPVDAAFVAAVARPPGGRLTPVVLERLARTLDSTVEQARAALFPPRAPTSPDPSEP